MSSRKFLWTWVVVLCAVVVLIGTMVWSHQIGSQNLSLQEKVLRIASQLRAPGDENSITVATSPSSTAQHIRFEIQQLILKDESESQIIAQMEQEYGQGILAAPAMRGFGSLVWIAPIMVTVLLLGFCLWFLRRGAPRMVVEAGNRMTPEASHGSGRQPTTEISKRVDQRLREYL